MISDCRYASRALLRQRGFAVVAILTLALGIGATTAIFSVVNALVLKPLPYEQPGQLVQAFEEPKPGARNVVSPGIFNDWRTQTTLFEGFAAFRTADLNFTGAGEPVRLNGLRMSANGLQLLRARPILGRIFAPDEDEPGKDKVVVLTHQLWQRQFGGARDIVGHTISLNGEPFTVIGVLPPRFLPYEQNQFVVPLPFQTGWAEQRGGHFLRVYARLKPGVSLEQGRAELVAVSDRSKPLYPDWKRTWSVTIIPLAEHLVNDIKPALLVLLAAVGLVLLIGCGNVANLLLARAAGRAKEIALRAALGASRARIIRQLLAESVILSLLGGLLGLAFAFWSTGALRRVIGEMSFPRAHEISLDPTVLLAATAISVLTGVVFGLVPALHASRVELTQALKEGARGSAGRGGKLRGGLIVGEVALSLLLLIGAGLLVRSFTRLLDVAPGFEPRHALTLQLSLADAKYPDNAKRAAFYLRVAERVAALPGVTAAGLANSLPLTGVSDQFVRVPGWSGDRDPGYDADYDICTPDYFRAMGIPLRRGRFFEPSDLTGTRRVAIINEMLARDCFPNEDPIGRQLRYGKDTYEIVGVVGDVRMRRLNRNIPGMVYRSISDDSWRNAVLIVRTAGEPSAFAESVRKAILELDPEQPVANVRTLEEVVALSVGDRRLTALLLGMFAVAALALAAVGLYGVVSYAVVQRTREIGIRVALGANRRDVVLLMLGQGMILVVIGLVLGLAGAFGLTPLLRNLLYEVKPADPLSFVAVSLVLLLVALIASWLPARRAARVDPMIALRAE
jgi:putative ABC transport system permease protein